MARSPATSTAQVAPDQLNRAGRRAAARGQRPAESLARRAEVAEYLDMPMNTLNKWATLGIGPRYVLIGRHARYRWSDVDAWLDEQRAGGGGARQA